MLCRVLFVILLGTSLFREVIPDYAVFVNTSLTYSGAVDHCNQVYNGSVWDQSELTWKNNLAVKSGETIWEQNRDISPWISVIGCYKNGTSTEQKTITIARRIHSRGLVIECFSQCRGNYTIALHNITCVCIEATQLGNGDFEKQPDSKCNHGWKGGKKSSIQFYTVYQRVKQENILGETDNHNLQCVYQNCRNRTIDLYAADCDTPPRQTLCSGLLRVQTKKGWDQGSTTCFTKHSKFLRGFQENNKASSCKPEDKGWIGVFRGFGNEYTREISSTTLSTTSNSNTEKVHSSTVPEVSPDTTKEVSTSQTTTIAPEFEMKYILIIAIGLCFSIVIIAAGLLCCRKCKRFRQKRVGLVLKEIEPNDYVDFKAEPSGTANAENNNPFLPTNYDEISDNNLTKNRTKKRHEKIGKKGLNDNGHYAGGCLDTTANAKSNEYNTVRETKEGDKYDTFQPNRKDSLCMHTEYSTTRDLTENNEYDTVQKGRNNLRPLDMYDTTRNLNSNSDYDVFQNRNKTEYQSENYSTARELMKEGEYDLIKRKQ